MTVVVDYQGPNFLRSFCEKSGIKIFERVTEIRLESVTLDQTDLKKQLAHLTRLKKITALPGGGEARLDEEETNLKNLIPECRLASLIQSNSYSKEIADVPNNQVTAELISSFRCPSD